MFICCNHLASLHLLNSSKQSLDLVPFCLHQPSASTLCTTSQSLYSLTILIPTPCISSTTSTNLPLIPLTWIHLVSLPVEPPQLFLSTITDSSPAPTQPYLVLHVTLLDHPSSIISLLLLLLLHLVFIYYKLLQMKLLWMKVKSRRSSQHFKSTSLFWLVFLLVDFMYSLAYSVCNSLCWIVYYIGYNYIVNTRLCAC